MPVSGAPLAAGDSEQAEMLKPSLIQSLPELPHPVLTVYLDTNREKQENRALRPGYLTWLKSEAQRLARTLPAAERTLFQEQADRVEGYLRQEPPRHRGTVIFAGSAAWEVVPVGIDVENELSWGAPGLTPLLWLLDEHRPCGVTLVGRKGARFFLHWLGQLLELEEKEFRLVESKKKQMGPVARPGVRMSRGTERDLYARHVAAQYAHFHQQIAERIRHWAVTEPLDPIFLVGLEEMVAGVQSELPRELQERVVPIKESLGWVSRLELERHLQPIISSHERKREVALVEALLSSDRGVVRGLDETLVRIEQGGVRRLVVVKALNAELRECLRCRWIDRTSDPVCPSCGGERRSIMLREVLPDLARRFEVSVEVVSGEAARRLQEAGGMGAWLREFEPKEYGQQGKASAGSRR